ncbi:unnamed protein product [Ambrosiozyma monospora]|uniref:Unnamed protein product n=1 Tax=Ambrosiozyma monospora TaxID=43982 RepID=A0ACB5STG3_AMBMO|nr:unnamed protein product [Ambrosiozyma monospora]
MRATIQKTVIKKFFASHSFDKSRFDTATYVKMILKMRAQIGEDYVKAAFEEVEWVLNHVQLYLIMHPTEGHSRRSIHTAICTYYCKLKSR